MPVALTGHQRVAQLVGLALLDEVADRGVGDQHLVGGDQAAADPRDQPLVDDAGERGGELDAHLGLLVGGEDVDDAGERLRGVVGVQRGEDQVAGLGDGQREPDRLQVAHLADQQHVGVLAQRRAQRVGERRGVGADLALVDRRALRRGAQGVSAGSGSGMRISSTCGKRARWADMKKTFDDNGLRHLELEFIDGLVRRSGRRAAHGLGRDARAALRRQQRAGRPSHQGGQHPGTPCGRRS